LPEEGRPRRAAPSTALTLELLRHGEAAPAVGSDAERPLTARGQRTVRSLGERLARERWRPDRLFTSPYRRARDTADLLVGSAGVALLPLGVEELEELAGAHEPRAVLGALARRGALQGHVVLVGHQPQLGTLAAFLVGAPQSLSPGDMLRIECRDGPESCLGTLVAEFRTTAG
jgi:phosphohistidine phosphatase SixA